LLHKLSISLFSFGVAQSQPASQARGGVSAPGYLVLLSSFPGGIPRTVAYFFVFPSFFLLSWIPTALMLFVCFPPWFTGGICELCLRGMAFVDFYFAVCNWVRCRAIWNYAIRLNFVISCALLF
jgi:hypothetical protein